MDSAMLWSYSRIMRYMDLVELSSKCLRYIRQSNHGEFYERYMYNFIKSYKTRGYLCFMARYSLLSDCHFPSQTGMLPILSHLFRIYSAGY